MSLSEELKSSDVRLEHVIKKSDTGLVFYRKCTVDGQSYNVGNNVLLRDEGRYKLGYLLKIYCRTKGNERALVRWFFTNIDFGQHESEQHYSHEIFATSYTGKVAVSSIRKLVHVIWVSNKDEIPENVPKDVYYIYRYFDHDKQALVPHRQQLVQIRYMPKPMPDSVGSSLSIKEKADTNVDEIDFSVPYTQNGATFYKVCSIGKDKYKIGDCVMLVDRDGSSIRRIISFSYNHEKRPIAMGQFIYYQNEVTLSPEERKTMHFQEVLVSNWKRELLISNIKKKLIVVHQNIFQPVPDNALKAVYFLKRYYDPFKKKIYPLSEPLTRSDFSIVPAPMGDSPHTPQLCGVTRKEGGATYYRKCTLGEDSFCVGNFATLQSGSVCVRVLCFYNDDDNNAVMNVNKLFTIRNVPSTNRNLLTTSLLFSSEVYHKVPCSLFFENICVVFNIADIVNDTTFVAGDFFDAETKELYKLKKPAQSLGVEEVPLAGLSLKKAVQSDEEAEEDSEGSQQASSSSESEDSDDEFPSPKKKKMKKTAVPPSDEGRNKDKNTSKEREKPKIVEVKNEEQAKKKKEDVLKVDEANDEKQKKLKEKEMKEVELMSELMTKEISLGETTVNKEYSWVKVGDLKANVGDCVFIKLVEGIQIGRIVSIYRDEEGVVRLLLYRFYLEEEMFVSKRESTTIHINEAFASDFVIHALAWQIDEAVDVKYLKKKELIPPQDSVPHGRLFVRRYYHPIRHLLRRLAQPLDAADLSIIPQPIPPIPGLTDESKSLNKLLKLPDQTHIKSVEKKTSKSDQADSDDKIEKSEERDDEKPLLETEGDSIVESARTKTAVLEPKSVVPQSVSPPPESSEVEMEDSTDVQQSESTVTDDGALKPEAATNYSKISIVSESDVNCQTMTILPENMITFTISPDTANTPDQPQTVQIIQQNNASKQQTIEIVPSASNTVPLVISSSSNPSNSATSTIEQQSTEQSTIEIVPLVESSGAGQIQIVTSDSNQIQVITDTSSIQIVPTTTSNTTSTTTSTFLPTIISSEQDLPPDMDVDITHAEDGCITIAPVTNKRDNTAKFEESYTKDGRVYFRKCHFKNETIVQGDAVYVRCNDQNLDNEAESWKLGRVMEFYHSEFPVVRLLWFYVVEEMVTSKSERASIHPQEVFASLCDDEIEISSIESKANVIYLKKGENIPKITEDTTALFCRRFYEPYKHSIRALKNRLSATDISILPEPVVPSKRNRSSQPSTPQEIRTPDVKRKRISSPTDSNRTPKRSVQNRASSTPTATTPKRTAASEPGTATGRGTNNHNTSKTLESKFFFATVLESDGKEAEEKEKDSVTKEPLPDNIQLRWKTSQNCSDTTQKAAVEEIIPVETTEDSKLTQTPATEETEEPQITSKTSEANETPQKPVTLQATSTTSQDSTTTGKSVVEETLEPQITEENAILTGKSRDSANQSVCEAAPQPQHTSTTSQENAVLTGKSKDSANQPVDDTAPQPQPQSENSPETQPQEISEPGTPSQLEEMKSNESHDLPAVIEGSNKPNVNEFADKNNVISDSCTTL